MTEKKSGKTEAKIPTPHSQVDPLTAPIRKILDSLDPSEKMALQSQSISEKALRYALSVAMKEQVPLTTIAILGGKAYVTREGLNVKLQRIQEQSRNSKKVEYSLESKVVKIPTDDDPVAIVEATLTVFDKELFSELIEKTETVTPEVIEKIKELATYRYTAHGAATPDDCEAICWKYAYDSKKGRKVKVKPLLTVTLLMAETRAGNRAIRMFTGSNTTIEEIPTAFEIMEESNE